MKEEDLAIAPAGAKPRVVHFVSGGKWAESVRDLPASQRAFAASAGFDGSKGSFCLLPGKDGKVAGAVFAGDPEAGPLQAGKLAGLLPDGAWKFEGDTGDAHLAALGFLLGAYRFTRYTKSARGSKTTTRQPRLSLSGGINRDRLANEVMAHFLARDLINTPANDMGPSAIEKAARALAREFKAGISVIKGDGLLAGDFPMIHAVGRASSDAPRLIDMRWGRKSDPAITLVGKGVAFDTGGLNIKPGNSMALMKKDMGGAANVLGLARMIMAAGLRLRLRVLVPAVENAISGNAFRPGDILPSRKGISVEIGNTDAEGRLILADALTLACEEKPTLIIDMATLTGAARIALGPDLPPFYTGDEKLAASLTEASLRLHDPLWRMPLWDPYESMLSSKVATTSHITSGGFAGSITAALFLRKFVEPGIAWAHFDIFGWVPNAKPWAPVGGEAQGIRALFDVIERDYSA